jgi:tetratricopeptide (TPR) repeat protein
MREGEARLIARSRLNFAARRLAALAVAGFVLFLHFSARAASPADAQRQFLEGRYEKVIEIATDAIEEDATEEVWQQLLVQSLLAVGRYPEADAAMSNALRALPRSVTLRWLAREAFSSNGRPEAAAEQIVEIPRLVSQRPWSYRQPQDLIAVGRALLASGVDPKQVLDRIYKTAQRAAPDLRDVYLASGELGLEKNDFSVAARHFNAGLEKFPKDPDLLYGRARAFAASDREEMGKALSAALEANPRHVPSLLLLADHQIDAEDYNAAEETLERARKVNPWRPEAWAYSAIIAHLRNDRAAEETARENALKHWPKNPGVPHLIGRKLSQKYRFAEGAALQRQALEFDPSFIPARAQLANDLLRLGETEAGWELIQEVHAQDAYDVTAYNLATLHDTLSEFRSVTNEHFVVRMHGSEAAIYGDRVLALLEKARETLVPKYGAELQEPTIVEIFPNPNDFGVRTFGMPDNPGYLGVCFGRVITANSPASQRGRPVNWQSVLWHEFCHVVTLQLTANKMPRWLSEGISTYEERVANPAWGEQLNPKYRKMILEGEATPISRLSAAFLIPKSGLHLQFAYYQSSLVVEFLIDRYGIEKLRAILSDLRDGEFINTAIERHTASMDELESAFTEFAEEKARSLAPELDWEEPDDNDANRDPGNNYTLLHERAARLIEARRWSDAIEPLQTLIRHYPNETGDGSAHALLARVHRELGNREAERAALEQWARVDDAATPAYLRLMEIGLETEDWALIETNAERFLAVDPLLAAPYSHLARASEKQGNRRAAIDSYQTLLKLEPPNPADTRFQLARLLREEDPETARRHLLDSLQDAPRNRAGLRLLLDLIKEPKQSDETTEGR